MYSSKTTDIFLQILRSAILDKPIDLPSDLNEYGTEIYSLAKSQDVLMLIYRGIKCNQGVLPKDVDKQIVTEIYRTGQNNALLKKAKEVLTDAKIPYIPLKGAVAKDFYPELWMRSCCDIDILVREKDFERAVNAFVKAGFSTDYKRLYHDVSLYYGEAHLELHFNICENFYRIDQVLSQVWGNVEQVSGYEYREKPAFFAFHNIAHLLYHFLRGGCNIKQFLDLWLMRRKMFYEEEEIQPFLSKCSLKKFYDVICEETEVLFEDKKPTDVTMAIERFIFQGGIAGGKDNADVISVVVGGGKLKYFINSLFIPMRDMKWHYPILRKYPVLLPLYYCKRLIAKTVGSEKKRAKELVSINLEKTKKVDNDIISLLEEIGLG